MHMRVVCLCLMISIISMLLKSLFYVIDTFLWRAQTGFIYNTRKSSYYKGEMKPSSQNQTIGHLQCSKLGTSTLRTCATSRGGRIVRSVAYVRHASKKCSHETQVLKAKKHLRQNNCGVALCDLDLTHRAFDGLCMLNWMTSPAS